MNDLRQAATALLEYLHGYDADYPEAAPIFNALRAALAEPWVGLTDEEILAEMPVTEHIPITSFARAIEAKLKEKNT